MQQVAQAISPQHQQGVADNTVIVFLADNGGCSEVSDRTPGVEVGRPPVLHHPGPELGQRQQHPLPSVHALHPWTRHPHPSPRSSPTGPAGPKTPGPITHQPAPTIDVHATCLAPADARHPDSSKARPADPARPLSLEPEGHQAARLGDWKLIRSPDEPRDLHHLRPDPSELDNLAARKPERTAQLTALHDAWMQANLVASRSLGK